MSDAVIFYRRKVTLRDLVIAGRRSIEENKKRKAEEGKT